MTYEQFIKQHEAEKVRQAQSQGALNRSARANIVLAAKASWGERITLKDKQEIEKLAKEIAKNTQTLGPVSTEYKLQKLVSDAGLGKLARKGILRNGQRSKLRASQLIIALEAGNENTEE